MSKVSDSNIIYALRCSSSSDHKCEKMEECPYFLKDFIPEELDGMADGHDEDGTPYCYGCDVDAIAIDAADRLEGLG